jgi:hypothetical protein
LLFCKCEEFRENIKGENEMPKENKVRTLLVVRYEPTAKDGKELLAKDNMSQAAVMYRALEAAKGPLTVKETYAACEGKCESGAAYERLGKNLNSSLFALRKAGFVKKSEKREEQPDLPKKAKPAKPASEKKARKPRAKKSKANGATQHADVSDSDIPQNEATA